MLKSDLAIWRSHRAEGHVFTYVAGNRGLAAAAAANSAKTVHSSLPLLRSLNQEHTSCCKQPIKCHAVRAKTMGN